VPSSVFGSLGRLFARNANRASVRPPATGSHDDPAEHGPIEEWFIRTAKNLLESSRNLTVPRPPKPRPMQQRIDALEAENARLRADIQRLADERFERSSISPASPAPDLTRNPSSGPPSGVRVIRPDVLDAARMRRVRQAHHQAAALTRAEGLHPVFRAGKRTTWSRGGARLPAGTRTGIVAVDASETGSEMVARGRIELPTRGFSVRCSTN
jgi:hypothetical protein